MSASYELRGDVAVITLNNPPVNGLGFETRAGVADGLRRAEADPAVRAIVLTGAGRAFSGGADIREFGSPKALAEPNLLTLIRAVEGRSPNWLCAPCAITRCTSRSALRSGKPSAITVVSLSSL